MHEVLVNRLGGLSLPRKSVVMLTDRPDMTLDVDRGCNSLFESLEHMTFQHGVHSAWNESAPLRKDIKMKIAVLLPQKVCPFI